MNNTQLKKLAALAALGVGAVVTLSAQINSSDAPGYFARGTAMFDDDNYVGAVTQLRQSEDDSRMLTPDEQMLAQRMIALSAMHSGDFDRAEQLLRQWLHTWGASILRQDVTMSVGDCLFQRSYADALKVYETVDAAALSRTRGDELLYRKAFCYIKLAEWSRGQQLYEQLSAGGGEYASAARFYLAYIAYAQHDYAKARNLFEALDKNTPPSDMADYYLSQIYYHDGLYDRALTYARSLLRKKTTVGGAFVAEANRIAGESLYMLDKPEDALPYLRKYVADTAEPAISALYILGLAEYADGNYAAAVKSLRPVTAENSSMGQNAYVYVGQSLMRQGDTDGAILAFDRALKMDYDDSARENAFYNYAVAKFGGGNVPFGSAVATFEEFLQKYPNSRYAPEVSKYIIAGYLSDNNPERALQSINSLRMPSNAALTAKQQILYTLGVRSLGADNIADAILRLTQAESLSRFNATVGAETNMALGEAFLRNDEPQRAVDYLTKYLAGPTQSDNEPVAYYDLGYARMALRQYEAAKQAFGNVVQRPRRIGDAAVADSWARIGDCLYYNKQWAEAADAYSRAYGIMPSAGDYPMFQQAVMLGYAGDFAGKLALLDKMLRQFPSSSLLPDALLEATEAQMRLGHTADAIETWHRLIDAYPATAQGRQAYLQLAMTLQTIGRTDEAVEVYRALISKYPTGDEAMQAAEAYKHIAAENGRLAEFADFMAGVDNAPAVDPTELDRLAFDAAESSYLKNGEVTGLRDYMARHSDGAFAMQACEYLLEEADRANNKDEVYTYACMLTDRWPDNAAAENAYALRAAAEYDRGDGEAALYSWKQLERRASTPAASNEARLGIMRVARDMGRADDLLQAAEAVLASSTLGAEDKTEASFSRALAFRMKGDNRAAIEGWRELAPLTNHQYGAKSAVYLAETLLDNSDRKGAVEAARALIDSGTPHAYWLGRAFIVLSDAYRAMGKTYEADEYLKALRENYPGTEADIFAAIEQRLGTN